MPVPWDDGAQMSEVECQAIAGSIAEFQLGESSEGKNLIHYAKRYAQRSGDTDYARVMGLFIAEENRHARELGRLMDIEGIPRKQNTFVDAVFRNLRRLAGLELSISVLVTAEIIAQVYYQALRGATGSTVLRAVCDQILKDEDEHVRFQCERLAILRSRRSRFTLWHRGCLHRVLMFGAIGVVWLNHRSALRRGGFGWRRFWNETWRFTDAALKIANPRRYVWDNLAAADDLAV